ncbi:Oligoribonuclease, mitochondrial [Nymphon striatum]|nr:Oligoribonuclease, mitochondrial [Nymphon striatum]
MKVKIRTSSEEEVYRAQCPMHVAGSKLKFVPLLIRFVSKNLYKLGFSSISRMYCNGTSKNTRKDSESSSIPGDNHIVWVDLEMTGLDLDICSILEMACLVTDGDLKVIAEGPNVIIHQPDEILDNMDEWCISHHGNSGLTQKSRESKLSLEAAETKMLSFVQKHTLRGVSPLAGNSVGEDKKFLNKYMPQFMNHLHYRIIDVSTVKELSRRWYPQQYSSVPVKKRTHRALDDILESIAELRYYRGAVFK